MAKCRAGTRQAFTLLELILSLALTAVLMAAVSMALQLNLKTLDDRRSVVEDAQLAKSVMHLLGKDLRATVQFGNTTDVEAGIDGASGAAAAGGGGAAGEAASGGGGEAGGGAAGGGIESGEEGIEDLTGETGLTENNTDIANALGVPTELGLYGNQFELQIDVSRPLRIDEYQTVQDSSDPYAIVDRPSDVKTIAYYVQGDQSGGAVGGSGGSIQDQEDMQPGLVRRSLDRATTMYAIENGNVQSLQGLGEVIAPEVTGIQFAYYDGVEWRTEWDSSVEGTLPIAIEIILAVRPSKPRPADAYQTSTDGEGTDQVYRMLVRLPVAKQSGQLSEEDAALQELGL